MKSDEYISLKGAEDERIKDNRVTGGALAMTRKNESVLFLIDQLQHILAIESTLPNFCDQEHAAIWLHFQRCGSQKLYEITSIW